MYRNSANEDECCGFCKYHKPDNAEQDAWICTNYDSDYVGEWTDFGDWCTDYEEKE